MANEIELINAQWIDINLIDYNEGQIEGVPRNPRTIDPIEFEELKKSIQDDPEMLGLREVLVYPLGGRFVAIGGNMRLKALRELRYNAAPCKPLPADTPTAKLRAYAIKDNVQKGEWDAAMLANDWSAEELQEWGVELPEFEEPTPEVQKETHDDDFNEDNEEIESRAKLGDIWALGAHRLMCGDSTDIEQVKTLCGGALVDCWLTDPPYNVALGYEGGASEQRQRHRRTDQKIVLNDSMPDQKFREFLVAAYTAAKENMKDGAPYYIFHADTESYNFRGALRDVGGLQLRETLIWVKDSMTLGRQDYQWRHEPCLYGWKEGAAHVWCSDRKQTTVLEFARPKRSEEHPTMKPIPLFAYLMQNSTKEGDVVLDTFGGSGTTLIAAEQLNRRCYMMELAPHYVDVILARWEKLTGKKAEKIN